MQGAQAEFQTSSFGLAQPWPLWSELTEEKYLSFPLSLPLCVTLPFKSIKVKPKIHGK